jgi:hypothetical protein
MSKGKPTGGWPRCSLRRHKASGQNRKPPSVLWHVQRLLETLKVLRPKPQMFETVQEAFEANKRGSTYGR